MEDIQEKSKPIKLWYGLVHFCAIILKLLISAQQIIKLEDIIMKNRNVNLQELRQKMKDLQEQIDIKEKELNMEVGSWVRKETHLDSLHEIQQNFRLVPVNNNAPKTTINTHTTALSSADITPNSTC